MNKLYQYLLGFFTFYFAINANAQIEISNRYSQIIEKLVFYEKDNFKVFYGGPIDRGKKGIKWIMPITFEENNHKIRAVYEVIFINCDITNASNAEILFLAVSDINIKFKNTLTRDYTLFSHVLAGNYKNGKYIVIRLADIANVYYPNIFISSLDGKNFESDKVEITHFLSKQLKTSQKYKDFYIGINAERISFENKKEIVFEPIPVHINIAGTEYAFWIEKRIRKNDVWKVYYVIAQSEELLKINEQVLLRLDSGCVSGQIYDDQSCDCLDQLHDALYQLVKSNDPGIIIHIPAHDGRGYGTAPKAETEIYKKGGIGRVNSTKALNTIDAAKALYGAHSSFDIRTFDGVAEILREMNINRIILLTDNVQKVQTLEKHGIKVFRQETNTNKVSCLEHINAKKDTPLYFSK